MKPQFDLPFKKETEKPKGPTFEDVFGKISYPPERFGGKDVKALMKSFLEKHPDGHQMNMVAFLYDNEELKGLPDTVRSRINSALFKMLEIWQKRGEPSYETYSASIHPPKKEKPKAEPPAKKKGGIDLSLPRGDRDDEEGN